MELSSFQQEIQQWLDLLDKGKLIFKVDRRGKRMGIKCIICGKFISYTAIEKEAVHKEKNLDNEESISDITI
jgi:hypothetical protein